MVEKCAHTNRKTKAECCEAKPFQEFWGSFIQYDCSIGASRDPDFISQVAARILKRANTWFIYHGDHISDWIKYERHQMEQGRYVALRLKNI